MFVCTCFDALRDVITIHHKQQDAPITLEGLQLLLSRESAAEPPQTYLITFNKEGDDKGGETQQREQRITDFPHPYPQVRWVQVGRVTRTHHIRLAREMGGSNLAAEEALCSCLVALNLSSKCHGAPAACVWFNPLGLTLALCLAAAGPAAQGHAEGGVAVHAC